MCRSEQERNRRRDLLYNLRNRREQMQHSLRRGRGPADKSVFLGVVVFGVVVLGVVVFGRGPTDKSSLLFNCSSRARHVKDVHLKLSPRLGNTDLCSDILDCCRFSDDLKYAYSNSDVCVYACVCVSARVCACSHFCPLSHTCDLFWLKHVIGHLPLESLKEHPTGGSMEMLMELPHSCAPCSDLFRES
eukprot:scaffold2770_cov18-Tisochrysis_lutea.AAC.1